MKSRNLALVSALGFGLLAGGILIAQNPPVENVNPGLHPHLAAAQHHIREAFREINEAQHANDYDMNGHAERARKMLVDAAAELKEAAETANRR